MNTGKQYLHLFLLGWAVLTTNLLHAQPHKDIPGEPLQWLYHVLPAPAPELIVRHGISEMHYYGSRMKGLEEELLSTLYFNQAGQLTGGITAILPSDPWHEMTVEYRYDGQACLIYSHAVTTDQKTKVKEIESIREYKCVGGKTTEMNRSEIYRDPETGELLSDIKSRRTYNYDPQGRLIEMQKYNPVVDEKNTVQWNKSTRYRFEYAGNGTIINQYMTYWKKAEHLETIYHFEPAGNAMRLSKIFLDPVEGMDDYETHYRYSDMDSATGKQAFGVLTKVEKTHAGKQEAGIRSQFGFELDESGKWIRWYYKGIRRILNDCRVEYRYFK